MSQEENEGHCVNCHCDFDLTDNDVQIVQHPRHGKALIVVNHVAHSLVMGKEWKRILRVREDENHARAINKYLDDEDIPEDALVTALEDLKGVNDIAGGEDAQ